MSLNPKRIALRLTKEFSVSIDAEIGADNEGRWVSVRPEMDRLEGFFVRVVIGWRSVTARFIPEKFAGPLLQAMSKADDQQRMSFRAFAAAAASQGAAVDLVINDAREDPAESGGWPRQWQKLSIQSRVGPMPEENLREDALEELVVRSAIPVLGMALSLLPLEPEDELGTETLVGQPEGAASVMLTNKYERSRVNRAACLAVHGTSCAACGFRFGETYGPFADGFIHVHHVVPVSRIGADYLVDPADDLIPLCPNCHAVAHLADPPLPLKSLQKLLDDTGQPQDGNVDQEQKDA